MTIGHNDPPIISVPILALMGSMKTMKGNQKVCVCGGGGVGSKLPKMMENWNDTPALISLCRVPFKIF